MTTARIPAVQLREQAAQVRPGRVAGTLIGAFFFALGFVAGWSWRTAVFLALYAWYNGLVYCAIAVRYGYWRGLGLTDEQVAVKVGKVPAPAG
jgi:hypothetical protein